MSISVNIEKDLGAFRLRVAFETGDQPMALLGASGSGKSMTLRCIAGLEKPDRGHIAVDGVTLFDSRQPIDLTPQQRRVGLLFQNYALFPHMTVLENLRAGARREPDRGKREEMLRETIARFGLSPLTGRYPHQLSGGQQQRVALARSLVSGPDLLLLDEPFSALDRHLRFQLREEVGAILRSFGKTVILVSHDQDEVCRLSDHVAVLHDGRLEAWGSREAVFSHPPTREAALLTGWDNLSPLRPLGGKRGLALDWGVELTLPEEPWEGSWVALRRESLRPGGGENTFLCRVLGEREGSFTRTLLLSPREGCAAPLRWEAEKKHIPAPEGGTIPVSLPPENMILLKG